MSSNYNSPIDHLVALAITFSAGVVATLAIQGYGLLMRHLGRHD